MIPEESQKSGRKKTILVVEDNEDIRFYLKDNLKGLYKVEEATNGKEGWEKIKHAEPRPCGKRHHDAFDGRS